jgi:4-hydroxy-3-polyprenylbenzoate decarboxylase
MLSSSAPVVLGVSGASAQPLAERAVQLLLEAGLEVEMVVSRGAIGVWQAELGLRVPSEPASQEAFWRERSGCRGGRLRCHRWNDQGAAIASGSFLTRGMVILPASMGTVGRIASGVALDLIERAADVHLKESRPLVIAPRELPWNLVHLRNLTALAEAGARIAPPVPAWYHRPGSIEEMVDFLVIRVFDSLGLQLGSLNRWQGRPAGSSTG